MAEGKGLYVMKMHSFGGHAASRVAFSLDVAVSGDYWTKQKGKKKEPVL